MSIAKTSAASETVTFSGSSNDVVSLWIFQVIPSAWTGSLTVQARLQRTAYAFQPIPYKRRYLNAVVADDTLVSTAITDASLIEVNAAGLDIAFAHTRTAGQVTIAGVPLLG